MATEEAAVADEFEAEAVPAVQDAANPLTSALVFMTTVLLLASIVVMMVALNKWYERGMFGK